MQDHDLQSRGFAAEHVRYAGSLRLPSTVVTNTVYVNIGPITSRNNNTTKLELSCLSYLTQHSCKGHRLRPFVPWSIANKQGGGHTPNGLRSSAFVRTILRLVQRQRMCEKYRWSLRANRVDGEGPLSRRLNRGVDRKKTYSASNMMAVAVACVGTECTAWASGAGTFSDSLHRSRNGGIGARQVGGSGAGGMGGWVGPEWAGGPLAQYRV